jgi:hypothetical protein
MIHVSEVAFQVLTIAKSSNSPLMQAYKTACVSASASFDSL